MTIEILSIGNELLAGHTINSNAAMISQALLPHGFAVDCVTTLPDVVTVLKKGVEDAMERSSFVITTGGLGPTGDDLTREVMSEVFQTPLIYNEEVAIDLAKRFSPEFPTLEDQAHVPKGALVLHNPIGTAPGFILTNSKSTVIVLPGVPSQMEALLEQVIPYLEKHIKKNHYVQSLYFCQLSEMALDPFLRQLEKENPGIQIGICPGYGTLAVFIHAQSSALLKPIANRVIEEFKPYFFSTTSKNIEVALQEWMIAHHKTFACAESCTGGHMAARLTAIEGASEYFKGSIVSYSNSVKESVLHVSPLTIKTHGAVSEEVVREMVSGVMQRTDADYAISVSGVAGPSGGSPTKPVGTIWGAIASKDQIFTGQFRTKGLKKRELVIDYAVTFLFSSLWSYLKHQTPPFL